MSMLPSGKIRGAFAGVFLIGALSGGLMMWGFTDRELTTFMNHTNDPESVMIARINKKYVHDYNLTPDEMARIQPLVQAMAHNTAQLRHQFALDFINSYEKYHSEIAAQLDPAHREAYQTAIDKRDKELRTMLMIETGTPDTGQK